MNKLTINYLLIHYYEYIRILHNVIYLKNIFSGTCIFIIYISSSVYKLYTYLYNQYDKLIFFRNDFQIIIYFDINNFLLNPL